MMTNTDGGILVTDPMRALLLAGFTELQKAGEEAAAAMRETRRTLKRLRPTMIAYHICDSWRHDRRFIRGRGDLRRFVLPGRRSSRR